MQTQGQFILMNVVEFESWLKNLKVNRQIKVIQEHHTWSPSYAQFKGNNQFAMVQGMKNYHLTVGFSDIAQNITTFPNGDIMICRPFDTAPAGIKGVNSYGICIENIGNFDKGGDIMTDAHKNTILTVSALLCKKFNLTPSINTLVYHHWFDLNSGLRTNGTGSTKTCPGTNFFGGNTVESANKYFIPLVKSKLNGGTINVVSPTVVNKVVLGNITEKTNKVQYCREWQKFYNEKTGTKSRLSEDNIYGKATQDSLDNLLTYIKQGKKYSYCKSFQIWFNFITQTSAKIAEDGYWGTNTEKAFNTICELVK